MINEELHALYEKKIAELQADLAASRNTINEIMPHPCRMREDGTCELGECEPCVPRLQYRLAAARAEIAGMVTVEQVEAWLESWNLDENPSCKHFHKISEGIPNPLSENEIVSSIS